MTCFLLSLPHRPRAIQVTNWETAKSAMPLFMRRNSTGVRLDVPPSAYFEHLASALLQDFEGFCYTSVRMSDDSAGIVG